jgi:pyruvate/2-oxoglutarate dehydrogenase complex dihydrolipoamide dehydrogenase (E3) component
LGPVSRQRRCFVREAVHGARGAAANARVDIEPALAWRACMVSDYFDAGQKRWLEDRGIGLLLGSGRVARPGVVEVDGVRHTANHVLSRPARIHSCRPGPARGVERHHSAVSVFLR